MHFKLLKYDLIIGLISSVFTNGQGYWVSIPSRVILKTQKMTLGAALLNTQHFLEKKGKDQG